MSASTIISISSWKSTLGAQPSSVRASLAIAQQVVDLGRPEERRHR